MDKFSIGIVVGGVVGVLGYDYMKKTSNRRKIVRQGQKIMDKAESMVEDFADDVWK